MEKHQMIVEYIAQHFAHHHSKSCDRFGQRCINNLDTKDFPIMSLGGPGADFQITGPGMETEYHKYPSCKTELDVVVSRFENVIKTLESSRYKEMKAGIQKIKDEFKNHIQYGINLKILFPLDEGSDFEESILDETFQTDCFWVEVVGYVGYSSGLRTLDRPIIYQLRYLTPIYMSPLEDDSVEFECTSYDDNMNYDEVTAYVEDVDTAIELIRRIGDKFST